MEISIKSPRTFLTGLFFLAVAGVHLWQGMSLNIGTFRQMGPGMFPLILEILLASLGLISIISSLSFEGDSLPKLGWHDSGTILGAVVVFGFLTPLFGVVVGLGCATALAGSASDKASIIGTIAMVIILVVFCLLVFVWGVGIPIKLFKLPEF